MTLEQQKTHGKRRSPQWPKVRRAFLKKHPHCFVCLGTKHLNVHHKLPFHLDPALELDETNLITLCEGKKTVNCHLIFGHWGDFAEKYNPHVVEDARVWRPRLIAKHMNPAL